jgi:hypothetical protein
MNEIIGKSKGPTVVEPPERIGEPGKGWGEHCSGAELCTMFLNGLDGNTFRNLTGLPVNVGTESHKDAIYDRIGSGLKPVDESIL